MKNPAVVRPPVFALVLVALSLSLSGCPSLTRELDPGGPYAGDRLLYQFDGVITEAFDVFTDVVGLADRNPAVVAAHPDLAAKVAAIRAEITPPALPDETLVKLYAARDAYVIAKTAANAQALETNIATARTLLETARSVLPLFVSSNP